MRRNSRSAGSATLSGWLFVVLAIGCTGLSAEQQVVRDKLFKILDWSGYDLTQGLEDGTSLYGYIAESHNQLEPSADSESAAAANKAEHDLTMRFTFLPRFQCSPLVELIGVLPDDTSSTRRVEAVRNFNNISVEIDGENFQFPVVVEEQGNAIHSFLSANLQRRTSLRILVEVGNRSTVTFGDGTRAFFSLEGSRDTITQALGRCRNHQ